MGEAAAPADRSEAYLAPAMAASIAPRCTKS